ncbi:MAG: hypothetical protein ACREMU_04330, partial [Gemmatimonadaceae bacterium]
MPPAAVATFHRTPHSLRVLRWIVGPLVAVHILLATISGYRAVWQIHRVQLYAPERTLHAGSLIGFSYVSTARVPSDAELVLIQGAQHVSVAATSLAANVNPSYDPRTKTASVHATLTPELLANFHAGPATLRVTAYGNMQWLRTPPPVVKELSVQL